MPASKRCKLRPSNWLLVFVPVALVLESGHAPIATSPSSSAPAWRSSRSRAGWARRPSISPRRTGEGIGGLLNATFGNAAELIIALVALRKGLYDVVKASLTGSIIGNVLLVLGASCLAGGLKYKNLKFNAARRADDVDDACCWRRSRSSCRPLSTTSRTRQRRASSADLSLEIAIVLLVCYGLSLLFSLHTHKQLFTGTAAEAAEVEDGARHTPVVASAARSASSVARRRSSPGSRRSWSARSRQAAHAFGMTSVFVGVIVVAIIGNAAEHSTAILVAMKNRMDLALGIAIGSRIQIALFVAPVLVFASYFIGPQPMDLVFSPAEVIAVVIAVAITAQVASDGESHWLEGVQLLAVYALLAFVFFALPAEHAAAAP